LHWEATGPAIFQAAGAAVSRAAGGNVATEVIDDADVLVGDETKLWRRHGITVRPVGFSGGSVHGFPCRSFLSTIGLPAGKRLMRMGNV
jgi:hypothetical protein